MASRAISKVAWRIWVAVSSVFAIGKLSNQSLSAVASGSQNDSASRSALGTVISVPTLGGRAQLKIPAGSQPDSVFRIRGAGIAKASGRGRGDLYVTVKVQVPTKLSRQQRELISKLYETEKAENQPIQKKILERVKEIFG